MADRLTQLQDCLDDINTLMYATLNYIETRHPYGEIEGQPSQAPEPAPVSAPPSAAPQSAVSHTNGDAARLQATTTNPASQDPPAAQPAPERPDTPPPERPDVFQDALRELAQGLVLKEQQMEILINSLPGLGNSQADQETKMRELEKELREVERDRALAEVEKEGVMDVLGDLLSRVGRVP